jgi:hypothetical protein
MTNASPAARTTKLRRRSSLNPLRKNKYEVQDEPPNDDQGKPNSPEIKRASPKLNLFGLLRSKDKSAVPPDVSSNKEAPRPLTAAVNRKQYATMHTHKTADKCRRLRSDIRKLNHRASEHAASQNWAELQVLERVIEDKKVELARLENSKDWRAQPHVTPRPAEKTQTLPPPGAPTHSNLLGDRNSAGTLSTYEATTTLEEAIAEKRLHYLWIQEVLKRSSLQRKHDQPEDEGFRAKTRRLTMLEAEIRQMEVQLAVQRGRQRAHDAIVALSDEDEAKQALERHRERSFGKSTPVVTQAPRRFHQEESLAIHTSQIPSSSSSNQNRTELKSTEPEIDLPAIVHLDARKTAEDVVQEEQVRSRKGSLVDEHHTSRPGVSLATSNSRSEQDLVGAPRKESFPDIFDGQALPIETTMNEAHQTIQTVFEILPSGDDVTSVLPRPPPATWTGTTHQPHSRPSDSIKEASPAMNSSRLDRQSFHASARLKVRSAIGEETTDLPPFPGTLESGTDLSAKRMSFLPSAHAVAVQRVMTEDAKRLKILVKDRDDLEEQLKTRTSERDYWRVKAEGRDKSRGRGVCEDRECLRAKVECEELRSEVERLREMLRAMG